MFHDPALAAFRRLQFQLVPGVEGGPDRDTLCLIDPRPPVRLIPLATGPHITNDKDGI